MEEIYPNGFSFVHDNLRVHTSTEDWAKNNGFDILKFPTYSPDLNIIENVWSALKFRVKSDNPQNERQVRDSLKRNWNALTDEDSLHTYFQNLDVRFRECRDVKGERLNY